MLRLGVLTRLRRLGLAGTSLKDAGLALVTPLAALETLSLEWCSRITDAGAHNEIMSRLPVTHIDKHLANQQKCQRHYVSESIVLGQHLAQTPQCYPQ